MKKRWLQFGLAAMLSASILIGAVPANVFADEEVPAEEQLEEGGEEVSEDGEEAFDEEYSEGEDAETASASGGVVMTSLFANNERMIAADYPDSILPDGFHKTSVNYQGENIQVAFMDNDANGEVVLAFLADADGNNGDFYLCDINTANMSDFVKLSNGERGYIIVLDPEDKVVAPSGFVRGKLKYFSKTVTAWQLPSVNAEKEAMNPFKPLVVEAATAGAGTVDLSDSEDGEAEPQTATMESDSEEDGSHIREANPEDFFMVYAIDNTGSVGFYLFDKVQNTYQRYVEINTENDLLVQYQKKAKSRLIMIIILAVLLLVAIFFAVNLFLQGGSGNSFGKGREDDLEVERMRKRVAKKEEAQNRPSRREMNYLMDAEDEAPRRRPRPADGEAPRRRPRPEDGEMPRRRPRPEDGEMPRRRPRPEDGEMPRRRPRPEDGEMPRRRPRPEDGEMPRRRPVRAMEEDEMTRRRPAARPSMDPADRVVRKGAAPQRRPSASVLDDEDFEYDYLK